MERVFTVHTATVLPKVASLSIYAVRDYPHI